MRLRSRTGAEVVIRPVSYQFEDAASGTAGNGWDENWLTIRGDVRTDSGRSWTFTDPCLTTWEARSIGAWIHGVLSGTVETVGAEALASAPIECFTEPNLAFSLAARTPAALEVRVHLSLEALPPWFDYADRPDVFDYYVLVDLTREQLLQAAAEWDAELENYPTR